MIVADRLPTVKPSPAGRRLHDGPNWQKLRADRSMSSSTACPYLPSAALGDSLTDLRVRTNWKRGPATDLDGLLLVSYTEFTPKTLRDVPRIHRTAERLRREIAELEGAIGATTYWQLFRGRVGSLSAWEDEAALRRFVALPFHLETMRAFRDRGSLLSFEWRTDSFRLGAAFREGQRALDGMRPS